jgi:hypothetical protein
VNWLKKLCGIKTDFEIMLAHMERTEERYGSLVRLSMGTVDRVVAVRFDRPTLAQEPPMPTAPISVDDLVDVNVDDDTWLAQ